MPRSVNLKGWGRGEFPQDKEIYLLVAKGASRQAKKREGALKENDDST